jgi:aspartyl protease family protein
MLKNAVFFASSALAVVFLVAEYMPGLISGDAPPPQPAVQRAAAATAAPVEAAIRTDTFSEKSIPADAGGQYSVDVLIDGQPVRMLVDTGATMVVISADLADRLGLNVEGGQKWKVQTANGMSVATAAVLPSIDLGTIYMKDVQALIADRSAGHVSLLGASFLKRLSSVEQRNGMLILRQ